MKKQTNQITWVGVNMFLLPCIARSEMARQWLLENAHDIEQFKINFPDAISTCGLLPSDEELDISLCVEKCPLQGQCLLPQVKDGEALKQILQRFKTST